MPFNKEVSYVMSAILVCPFQSRLKELDSLLIPLPLLKYNYPSVSFYINFHNFICKIKILYITVVSGHVINEKAKQRDTFFKPLLFYYIKLNNFAP